MIDLASGARNRIVNFPGTNSGAAFSPDGGRIALSVSKDGNPELYVVSAGGGGARRLTHSHGAESSPSWSPNGDELVFAYDDGMARSFIGFRPAAARPQQLDTGHGYCTEPNWSPDGKKIAFNIRGGGSFQVAVLDLNGGGTRVLSSRRESGLGRGFAASDFQRRRRALHARHPNESQDQGRRWDRPNHRAELVAVRSRKSAIRKPPKWRPYLPNPSASSGAPTVKRRRAARCAARCLISACDWEILGFARDERTNILRGAICELIGAIKSFRARGSCPAHCHSVPLDDTCCSGDSPPIFRDWPPKRRLYRSPMDLPSRCCTWSKVHWRGALSGR